MSVNLSVPVILLAFSKIQKEREDDHVIRFLKGLNDEFDSIKSGVLMLDPMPSVDQVFFMAVKLEREMNDTAQGNNGIMHANVSQGNLI